MNWQIYAIIGTIALSLAYLIEKKSLIKEHALQFVTIHAIFSVILSIFFFPQVNIKIAPYLFLIIYISSLGWTFAGWYLAKAIRHMQLSSTTPLLNVTPGIVAILAFIFLRDVLSIKQMFGMGLLIVGTYVLETHSKKSLLLPFKAMFKSKYTGYVIMSILIASITAILDKYILNYMNAFTFIFIIQIFMLLNLLFIMHKHYGGLVSIKHGLKKAGVWIFMLSLLIVFKRLLFAHAISLTNVSLVIAIAHTSSLFTVIVGGELFHEKNLTKKVIATIIMVIGVFLIV